MKDNFEKGPRDEELHRRQKKMFLILVVVFILAIALYAYSKITEDTVSSNPKEDDLINSSDVSTVDSDYMLDESNNDVEEEEEENMRALIKEFIAVYYSYDYKNPLQHVELAEPYLTKDFYAELYDSEMNSMEAPVYKYRKITDIKYYDLELDKTQSEWRVMADAELFDEENNLISTITVEFNINLLKESDGWKVSYFSLIGKGIEVNE